MTLIQTIAEILLILSCLCALFSEKIESHCKSNANVKQIILVFSAAVSIISIVTLVIVAIH